MNDKLLQAGEPTIEVEESITITLVNECGDGTKARIQPPSVDNMTTTVKRATEEIQVLTGHPTIILDGVNNQSP